jgi:hypothetical protein
MGCCWAFSPGVVALLGGRSNTDPFLFLLAFFVQPGNIFFRRLVRAKQEEYLKANKREKTIVAKDIVRLIRMLTPPGRFLKKDPSYENMYGMFLIVAKRLELY